MPKKNITILVLHGPNLNMLGQRNHEHYGAKTLKEINGLLRARAQKFNCKLIINQSNHEGELIDLIQKHSRRCDGILINPAALTHYSIALRDALEDSGLPLIEVHLSNISKRESFRRTSLISDIAIKTIKDLKEQSYIQGLLELIKYIKKQ